MSIQCSNQKANENISCDKIFNPISRKNTYEWDKLPLSKKIRIMFKKQHYTKDEFSKDYRGIYAVYLDNVMYINNKPFPQIGTSNCWSIISKKGGSFVLFKIGFTNNECEGKSIYFTILNFGLWCRW